MSIMEATCEWGLERSEEEFGPELEKSSILCWISSVCLSRSLFTLVTFVLGRTSVGPPALQLLVGFRSAELWQEAGRREESNVKVFALLAHSMRSHLELAVSPNWRSLHSKADQVNLSFKDQVTFASSLPSQVLLLDVLVKKHICHTWQFVF